MFIRYYISFPGETTQNEIAFRSLEVCVPIFSDIFIKNNVTFLVISIMIVL